MELKSRKQEDHEKNDREKKAQASLIGANFFVETNRLEPLLAVYLIEFKNWNVVWVGYVSVVMNILMLTFQTPVGDIMDRTRHKKLITAASLVVGSITTASVAWNSRLYYVIPMKALEGIAATVFLPALMSLLLGVVPEEKVTEMVSITEASNKIGTLCFTIGTGFLSYYAYPNVSSIFYLLGAGGLAASIFILLIPNDSIDNMRARAGYNEEKDEENKTTIQSKRDFFASKSQQSISRVDLQISSLRRMSLTAPTSFRGSLMESHRHLSQRHIMAMPTDEDDEETEESDNSNFSRYKDILSDRKIVMFALLTFFYHLSNAAVLPLVSQLIAQEDQRSGLAFTSGVLSIIYLVQAPTAYMVGKIQNRFEYKTILMVGHLSLPIRCALCALLAIYFPNRYALAATQIFEGFGSGIYDTLMPIVVKELVRGSGRYGFTFGFIITCWRLGHGLSLLLAESILKASHERYEVPFFVLGGGGIFVTFMLAFAVTIQSKK